jgi:hypothetical protein
MSPIERNEARLGPLGLWPLSLEKLLGEPLTIQLKNPRPT